MIPRLKTALREVAIKAQLDKKYDNKDGKGGDEKLKKNNDAAVILFGQEEVYRRVRPTETPRNITALALLKVDRYARRNGMPWRLGTFEQVKNWLFEHWDEILKLLVTLLPLVIV